MIKPVTMRGVRARDGASQVRVTEFRKKIYSYYRLHRRSFPWREHRTPYRIVVSEIMLQQTQAPRVVPKYRDFLRAFPSFSSLARASVAEVLRHWQGLGYNRRALFLRRLAITVTQEYRGKLPREEKSLRELPGIGPATAASICAFAYNQPSIFIETNIRAVFIHEFFPKSTKIPDSKLWPLITLALDQKNPRDWYYALMDYGVYLKQTMPNPSRRSALNAKTSKFIGSNRQLRGLVLRTVLTKPRPIQSIITSIEKATTFSETQIMAALENLSQEGFLAKRGNKFAIRN